MFVSETKKSKYLLGTKRKIMTSARLEMATTNSAAAIDNAQNKLNYEGATTIKGKRASCCQTSHFVKSHREDWNFIQDTTLIALLVGLFIIAARQCATMICLKLFGCWSLHTWKRPWQNKAFNYIVEGNNRSVKGILSTIDKFATAWLQPTSTKLWTAMKQRTIFFSIAFLTLAVWRLEEGSGTDFALMLLVQNIHRHEDSIIEFLRGWRRFLVAW